METVVKHEINPLLDGIMPGEIMKLDGRGSWKRMFFADFPWMLKSASNAHDVWVKFKVWLTYKLGAVGNQYKVKGHEL
eukprot:jgi/Botrbrau1/14593/Bobra.242_2s0003.1